MNKRKLFAGLFGLCAVPVTAIAAKAATYKPSGSASFVVPANVDRIRVRSWKEGRKVLDREMSVEPGQIFRIDPV
jgi:hypothetical protein